jgi:hypothetical protein
MRMIDELAEKKQHNRREMLMDGCLLAVTLPAVAFLLILAVGAASNAISAMSNGWQNAGVVLGLILLCIAVLVVVTVGQVRRFFVLLNRIQGIQRERERTAHLADYEMSRLELNESEIDTVTLPDDEQRRIQRRS